MSTFFGGIPTDIDVKKLRETWPEQKMQIGDRFGYDEIAKIIKANPSSSRFRTVTNRWRRIAEQTANLVIGPVDATAFKVLSHGERLDLSQSKTRTAARSARRSIIVLSLTDRSQLTSEEQAAYDHQENTSAKIIAAAQLRRRIALPE